MTNVERNEWKLERLHGCEEVTVLPEGFREPAPPTGIPFPNYLGLKVGFTDYNTLATDQTDPYEDYADLMKGHPGYEGGIARRPGGNGVLFGIKDFHGTEWWLTDAEGLLDSPEWEPRSLKPALGDGSWLLDVRANAREVVLKGTLVGVDKAGIIKSLSEGVSALAAPPRTGWVRWNPADGTQRHMPVALTGRIKTAWKNDRWCEFEMEMMGVDIGTAGAGVFMESVERLQIVIRNASETTVMEVPGAVPSPPTITFNGPINVGTVVQLSDASVHVDAAVAAGKTLVVNCQSKRVMLDGVPARSMVGFGNGRWPLMPVGAVPIQATKAGSGTVSIEVTPLW